MERKVLIYLLLLSVCLFSFSQEPKKWNYSYTYRYLGVRDGLVQTQAILSFQDSYGYLWFSTYDGVSRFDGLHFENFSRAELHTGSSRVRYLNQYESAVYMISGVNIVFVNPDRTMEYYPLPDSSRLLSIDYIGEVAVVGDNLYIFNCQSPTQENMNRYSLIRFDLKNKTYTEVADNLPYLRANIFDQKVYAVTGGNIQNQQLTLYRIDNERLQTIQTIQTIQMEKTDLAVDFRKTNRNEWFALLSKKTDSGRTKHFYNCVIENDSLRWNDLGRFSVETWGDFRFARWDDHRILIGTNATGYPAFILDTDRKSLSAFPLSMIAINHILIDRDGNIWFSTEDGIYECSRTFFESYQLGLGHSDDIWGIFKDSRSNVWFSSYTHGLWRADVQGNLYHPKAVCNKKEILVRFGYMWICEDSKGRIIQTHSQGLSVYDPKQGDPNRLEVIPTGISLAIYHDKENGNIYFGGANDTVKTLNILHANGKISSYSSAYRYIVSICRDGNGKLRLGDFSGDTWFDEEKQIVVSDTVQHHYGVISMALDENGILWKGTTQGIFAEDRQGRDRQISNLKTNFVLQYKNHYVIWGVKDKLYLLDLQAYHRDTTVNIRCFSYYDGFDGLECVQNGASIDGEGYVWVTGSDKVIRFLPEQIMKTPPPTLGIPYMAAIYNANKNSEWSLIPVNSPLVFDNDNNYLRFDILLASVTVPDKLLFRYKLNGYNEQWATSSNRSFIFQNLPFGKFRLEMQSSFDDGQKWSESVFSPEITIRNPFLLTVPGLALIILGFAGIAAFIIYYTRKISIRKEEEKRMIEQLKHKAVQAKFIPHFTGNVLNSINYLISKNPQSAQKYISDFAGFSNQTLLSSDTLYRTIKEELDYCQLYLKLEKLRFEEKLEYEVSVASGVDMQKMVPTMALQTFCENAIKHGLRYKPDGGKIIIQVYPEADYTALIVEDNGIGREKAQTINTEGTKEGLKIVQQQLDIFNKNQSKKAYFKIVDLHDDKGNPSGTRFKLYIP